MDYPKHIVATATLIQNKQDKFLLVKTERRGWEMPGGQVEKGENIISALKREVIEESGIEIDIKKLSAIYSSVGEPSKVIFDFISEYKDGDIQKVTGEIMDADWFSREEVLSAVRTDPMQYRILWLLENQDKIRHASYAKNSFKVLSETLL